MNDLIGNNYEPTEEQIKAKKMMKIVGVILVILLIICIALIVLMYYIQASQLKITIDGKDGSNLKDILLIEENQIYVPIREFAKYVDYESYSGDYKQYAEDNTKCYVESKNEIASFTMNSDKIYKLLSGSNDYEYFTIDEPVKMINNVLYTTMSGAEKAFNISFSYDKNKNQITIYTLPYLVTYWTGKFPNSAIADEKAIFSNKKALLYDRIVVANADGHYGVYNLSGNEILGTKYNSIEFIESTKEFTVTTGEGKMGIMSYDATTKIRPEYDDIKQIDKDAGLYLVTNNKKQGVINKTGSIIVYLEYDQIGIDASKYNNIRNQYLLYDNYIPVMSNKKWGMFDKTGRQILELEYDEFGCSGGTGTSGSKTDIANANNVLLIQDYEAIVVKKDDFYGIIEANGKELIPIVLTSVYSTTSSGEEIYYMISNNQKISVIDYIKKYVKTNNNTDLDNTNNTKDTENNENTQNNTMDNNVTNQSQQNNITDQAQQNDVKNQQTQVDANIIQENTQI